eukprot:6391207-Amphidinium_carterae.1
MESVPGRVWEILSEEAAKTPSELRSQVMDGAMLAWAYIWMRVVRETHSWPWRLVQGDIATNLDELGAMECPPEEAVASKIWTLL